MNFIIWSVALLLIPLGLLLNMLPGRALRYAMYLIVYVSAGLMELFRVSFVSEIADRWAIAVLTLMALDIAWNLRRLKNAKLRRTGYLAAGAIYFASNSAWLLTPPAHIEEFWQRSIAARHRTKAAAYAIEVRDFGRTKPPFKRYYLTKKSTWLPFERTIHHFDTPHSYYLSDFAFQWSGTGRGIRLDLYDGETRIWTMGEGFETLKSEG
ncbi:MAG: hypothetical protein GF398_06850 [Chitinivibrionales bacterium]|nr:hypothetical protein [Chitinivibrionales bacterium]